MLDRLYRAGGGARLPARGATALPVDGKDTLKAGAKVTPAILIERYARRATIKSI